MKIKAFQVTKYRSVEDSGRIDLLDNLTCIVGKNQSGKTALLRALFKFNPRLKNPYDLRREWPRGQRHLQSDDQVVCTVWFQLEPEEKEGLAGLTTETLNTDQVVVTKDYAGRFEVTFADQPDVFPDKLHPNAIDEACEKLRPPTSQPVGEGFQTVAQACIEEARVLAREGRFAELASLRSPHKQKLEAARSGQQPQHTHENNHVNEHDQRLQVLEQALKAAPTMQREAHNFIVKHLPIFIYMDDYLSFEGSARLDEVKQRRDGKRTTAADDTFLMILELAGLDLDELIVQGQSKDSAVIHDRQLDLQDAATTLTQRVAGRWGQNEYRIEFRADGQNFFTDIEETQKNIGMIPLEEQSKGFQWFFSFDMHFMHDSGGSFKGCVLLLDEPGLHLHPGGQEDLLKRLDAYSAENVTIYSTHLPFLIDLREPARIRVIQQIEGGTVVSGDLGTTQADERLTLQAALGMKARQSYLVSTRNLVVEGVNDYWIVTELSNLLLRAGQSGLAEDVMVTAAGSASEAVNLATFMIGQELEVLALFDSDDAGMREEKRLRTKWLTSYKDSKSSTLLLGDAINVAGAATIEDMFPDDYYLEKMRTVHASKLASVGKTPADLTLAGTGPLLPRAEAACAGLGIEFNKGSVAKVIRRELAMASGITALPAGTNEKAQKLFRAIGSKLGWS